MSQKINGIIFSCDRAAQLSIFLESVNKYAPDVFDLTVIINHTSKEFEDGYNIVINNDDFEHINFVKEEEDFRYKTLQLLNSEHKYSCFFLDDNILYKEVNQSDIESCLEDVDVVCFSLRLGENTKKCYTLGAENVIQDMTYNGNTMKWDWTLRYLDFGYPFSIEGHIYRTKDIYKLMRKCEFSNAEELESSLFEYTETFPRNLIASYKESTLVGVPAGRVQQSIEDKHEMALKKSEARVRRKNMNTLFLKGDFKNLESIDFSNIEGCHQKLDLGYIEIESSALDKIAIVKYGKRWDEISDEEQNIINDSINKIEETIKNKEK